MVLLSRSQVTIGLSCAQSVKIVSNFKFFPDTNFSISWAVSYGDEFQILAARKAFIQHCVKS